MGFHVYRKSDSGSLGVASHKKYGDGTGDVPIYLVPPTEEETPTPETVEVTTTRRPRSPPPRHTPIRPAWLQP